MAQGIRYVCENCYKTIEAWDDGHPYYIDDLGAKHYAYHPDHSLLPSCVGNDEPYLCLACGNEFNIDSRLPVAACPKCGSVNITDTFHLDGKLCPDCKAGVFSIDPDFHPIS